MNKVLVTGGTGFTGSKLVFRLLNSGAEVRVLARENSDCESLRGKGAVIVRGDVTDKKSVSEALDGVDTVFHIAAAFREAKLPDEDYRRVNVGGTGNVLEACLARGVGRIVHCSTIGVHGDVKEVPAGEESPFNPGDIYQETKLEGELLARKFFAERRAPVVIIRPCGIYGPGDLRFLKLFRAIARGRFVMVGSGDVFWHPVYVENLVDGFLLAARADNVLGECFLIGDGEYLTLNELVGKIAGVLGVPPPKLRVPAGPVRLLGDVCEKLFRPLGLEPPLHRRRVDFFTKTRAFDITKAVKVLGYSPRCGIDEGLRLAAQWYKSRGLL